MNIGFIGTGNMGGAIAMAVAKSSLKPQIFLTDHDMTKAQALAEKISATAAELETLLSECDYIFLGVKPQVLPGLLRDISAKIKPNCVFISMAAGVKMETIAQTLGEDTKIIRIMPNTPVSVGAGMTMYDASAAVSQEELTCFLALMEQAGKLDRLPEGLIDAGCAVAGCGPAFAFLFAEALADGGVACGLPRDKAMAYAAQMLYGSADLLIKSGRTPGELKDAVCSPGGSTIRGVHALEEGGLRGTVMDAVVAAFERTKELG